MKTNHTQYEYTIKWCLISFLRDEQYNLLWNELETITDKYRELSEHHRMLYDFVCHAASQSPSSQSSRLNQTVKGDNIHVVTYIRITRL